jgi:hypothetical protein
VIGRAYVTGRGFKGLAAYLRDGHLGELRPDRVEWMDTRNLPTRDPAVAARIMAATARLSTRTQNPVYHFSVSLDPGDPVDRDTLRRVADRTLRDLELEGYQVLIVAHRDRAHRHLHFMVNRVHPERGTAWSNSFDWRRIEESMRAQEADLGLRIVPGRLAPVPEQARTEQHRAPVRAIRGDAAFLERVRRDGQAVLEHGRTWGEVERVLGEHGLSVRVKNGGMVVTDGVREVKASEVGTFISRRRLESRLGPLGDYRARQAVAARALEERAARVERVEAAPELKRAPLPEPKRAPAPAPSPAQAPPPAPPQPEPAPQRQAEAQPAPEPEQPPQPKQAPPAEQLALPLETRREAPPAPQTPQQIELLLPLEPEARRSAPAPALVPAPNRKRAPEPPEDVPLPPVPAPPPPMPQRPGPAVPPPPPPARAPVRGQAGTYGETVRDYYHATRELFADPDAARRAFLRAAEWRDPESAARTLRDRPEHFGALRPGATHALAARTAEVGRAYAQGQRKRKRPVLEAIAAPLRQAAAARAAVDAQYEAEKTARAAATHVDRTQGSREHVNETLKRFGPHVREVYADMKAAVDALEAHRAAFGMERTVAALAKTPEQFGDLKRTRTPGLRGVVVWFTDAPAREEARRLAVTYREMVQAWEAKPSPTTRRLAAEALAEANKARDAAQAVRERFRDVDVPSLLREAAVWIRSESKGVPARQEVLARRLAPMLPASAAGLIREAIRIARAIDHDLQHDRSRDRGPSL